MQDTTSTIPEELVERLLVSFPEYAHIWPGSPRVFLEQVCKRAANPNITPLEYLRLAGVCEGRPY